MTEDKIAVQATENTEELRPIYCPRCGSIVVKVTSEEYQKPRDLFCPYGHVAKLPNGIRPGEATKVIIYGAF